MAACCNDRKPKKRACLALAQLLAGAFELLAKGVQLLRHALLRLGNCLQLHSLLVQLLQRLFPLPARLQRQRLRKGGGHI